MKQQELEESNGHRRKRKSSAINVKETELDKKTEKNDDDKVKGEERNNKPKSEKKTFRPPMEFAELLKLAEKKQYEPVIIEVKPKIDEERLMTKRQKKEWEYIQEKQRRDQREKINSQITKKSNNTNTLNKVNNLPLNKTPKKPLNLNPMQDKTTLKDIGSIPKKVIDKSTDKQNTENVEGVSKDDLLEERKKLEMERKHLKEMRRAIDEEKRKLAETKSKQAKSKPSNTIMAKAKVVDKQVPLKNVKSRSFLSENLKLSSLSNSNKSKAVLPDVKLVKSKQVTKKLPMIDKKREFSLHYVTKLLIIKI